MRASQFENFYRPAFSGTLTPTPSRILGSAHAPICIGKSQEPDTMTITFYMQTDPCLCFSPLLRVLLHRQTSSMVKTTPLERLAYRSSLLNIGNLWAMATLFTVANALHNWIFQRKNLPAEWSELALKSCLPLNKGTVNIAQALKHLWITCLLIQNLVYSPTIIVTLPEFYLWKCEEEWHYLKLCLIEYISIKVYK